MALTVQDDTGAIAGANAYIDVVTFKSYHDDRGNTYTTDDTKIASAIIRATDYLDSRFNFQGIQLVANQTTQWPRQAGAQVFLPWWDINFLGPDVSLSGPSSLVYLTDASGNPIVGIPLAVKHACAEYALRALAAPLYQDAPAPDGGRMIAAETVTVDVITHEVQYAPSQGTGQFQMPAYPAADMMLARAGLIQIGRQVYR